MRKIIAIIIIFVFLLGILYPIETQAVKKPKSENTAILLSLGATIIPCTVGWFTHPTSLIIGFGMGTILGPSVGHFYAEQSGHALWGIGIRALGIGAGIATMRAGYGKKTIFDEPENSGLVLTGLGLLGVTGVYMLYDIFEASSSVRKYNESIKKTDNVYFVPKIDLKEENYGLSLVYYF